MTNAFAKVARYVANHNLLTGAHGVVVAVSGGPDSVALLDLLVRLRDAEGCEGLQVHVAHLNHQLRGTQAEEDAEFVARLAESRGLEATIEIADVQRAAADLGKGIEEVARDLRYRFLLDLANTAGFDLIATGHTMSDQAETLLMRLVRGAGPRGLAGMRAAAAVPVADAVRQGSATAAGQAVWPRLIRPLLCITREEVEEYCRERKLDFRLDASNRDIDFTRNRVRLTVLPALQAINPRAVQAIARAAEDIAAEHDAIDHMARSLLAATPRLEGGVTGVRAEGGIAYRVSAFLSVPAGLRSRMLFEAIRMAEVGKGVEIGRSHVTAVEQLLENGASGKRVRLPGGLEVWREFELLVFKQVSVATAKKAVTGYVYQLGRSRLQVDAGGITLAMRRGLSSADRPGLIEEARHTRKEGQRDWVFAALDDDALPAMLVVRPRQPGERGLVLGHQQTIKLKKLMIDHKIPASRRALWPVVTTPDGRYIWSPGLPPAVDFAARDETRAIAIVRALNF